MNSGHQKIAGELPLVAVVDDDESVRESLPDLLGEFGFARAPSPPRKSSLHPIAWFKLDV